MSEVKLHLGDCLEFMRAMPDKSVDAVITDPPYGIGADKGVGGFGASKTDRHYSGEWDNGVPSLAVFDEIARTSTLQIIFGGNYFTDKLRVNGHWIVWDKVGEMKFKNPFSDAELLWTSAKKNTVKKYVCIQQGFVSKERERYHPTQKPVELLRSILLDYTDKDDTVFDPFMGSGTTGVAAIQTGRNFIGCELDPEYFAIAEKRIADAQLQTRMNI